jgi:hypothetical protein
MYSLAFLIARSMCARSSNNLLSQKPAKYVRILRVDMHLVWSCVRWDR